MWPSELPTTSPHPLVPVAKQVAVIGHRLSSAFFENWVRRGLLVRSRLCRLIIPPPFSCSFCGLPRPAAQVWSHYSGFAASCPSAASPTTHSDPPNHPRLPFAAADTWFCADPDRSSMRTTEFQPGSRAIEGVMPTVNTSPRSAKFFETHRAFEIVNRLEA